jgi:hypothetical protein
MLFDLDSRRKKEEFTGADNRGFPIAWLVSEVEAEVLGMREIAQGLRDLSRFFSDVRRRKA